MKQQVGLMVSDVILETEYIVFVNASVDMWHEDGYLYEAVAYELMRYPHPEHGEPLTHPYNYLNADAEPIMQRRHYCVTTLDAAWQQAQRMIDEWVPLLEAMYDARSTEIRR